MAWPGGKSPEENLRGVQDYGESGFSGLSSSSLRRVFIADPHSAGSIPDRVLHLLADQHHPGGLHPGHPSPGGPAHTAHLCLCWVSTKQTQDLLQSI